MTTDHTKTSKDLKGLVDSGDVKATIPVKLDSTGQKKLDELNDAKPEDFARYYDPMQVSAHKDAVSLFERYAKSGDNPKLKDWAGKMLPALQHHLEMAENLNKNRD
jgi:putative membrane protein